MLPQTNPFRTETWQVRYLFDLGFQGWLVHIGVVGLTGWLLVGANPDAMWPVLWTGLMLVLSVLMALLCKTHASGTRHSEYEFRRAGWGHTILTALVGLTWGYGAIVVYLNNDFEILAVYSLALGGTALGAVSSQHAVPRSAFTSIWTSVPLLALAHKLEAGDPAIGAMVMLYALILSILTARMHRFLATNHNLTQSLDEKVGQLTRASADLIKAREEAEEANLSKSRFLAQASHDLRQPIHAIGLLTASLEETRLNREQRQMVESIESSVESVTSLFGSLLDISRLDVGGVTAKPAPVQLGAFLDQLVTQNRELAAKANCTLAHVQTSAWVETDGNLLFTMVQNVLGNAFKYAPGSRVLIGPRRVAGHFALQICDTGPGIEPTQIEAVFSEFYRLETAEAGNTTEGMGLGLAIVRGLGDLLDLDVRLASVPGRGTSVIISGLVPTVPASAAPARKSRSHLLSGKRICLIDDDETVRNATVGLLERWGCIVDTAASSGDVAGRYDAILADMQLGDGQTGIDAIEAIRRQAGRDIPAVVLTGHSDSQTRTVISAANLPVLSKPVRPAELRAMLTRLCLGL
ncbi:MAG: hybrid sensor histidine kinase/response regulator [Devosia sp.]|uniref:ATP-binding response regulator n=1 Tax=Devosia sp. TaxID=1871048 RepID=UPI0024CA2622|nr:hybrid sensor histidine kinase/response regulator [Devosia sp.]UYN99921.1 MAG: hybrid sensor histidine kinase/response regulator [Devosia sp.]